MLLRHGLSDMLFLRAAYFLSPDIDKIHASSLWNEPVVNKKKCRRLEAVTCVIQEEFYQTDQHTKGI